MKRILQYDQIDLAPTKITQRDDPLFGPVTVFHDVPIARTIVQQYEDGLAYKPADELEAAAWTATDRWVVIGRHPNTAIVSSRGDIGGRTTNIRFTNSLINSKTKRPEDRGILADLEVFDNKVPSDMLIAMKSGTKRDVSIGFFFDQDATPGVIGDDYPQLKGTEYDYVQRNIMIDHTAAALDTGSGRCAFPECGIGADQFQRLVTGDPFAGYENHADCVAKNQDKDDPDAFCAWLERKVKEARKKKDEGPRSEAERAMAHFNISEEAWNKLSDEEKQDYISRLPERGSEGDKKLLAWEKVTCTNCGITWQTSQSINSKCWRCEQVVEIGPEYEWEPPKFETPEHQGGTVLDYVGEEAQGQAASMTESKRAQMYFSIPEDEWAGLSEEEKEDYISRLPPKKKRAGGEEMSERDCVYEWDVVREKLLQKVPDKDRVKSAPAMLQRIITALVFDGDSVTVTAETMDKLREYGIDLEPCERDEEIEEEETGEDEAFGGYKSMGHCVKMVMEDNPSWTEKRAQTECAKARKQWKARRKKDEDDYDEYETWIIENIEKDAALTSAQKRGRPDSDYAFIEKGCKKVDGKTEQKCRHFLIYDPAHVRAALAALKGARTGKIPQFAKQAKPKICTAAKKFKIKSEVCGTEKEKDEKDTDPLKDAERIWSDKLVIMG